MSRWLPEIRRMLAAAALDPAREAEIVLELDQHLEDRYHELRAAGVDDEEATRAALDELREDHRMRAELRSVEARERPAEQLGAPTRQLFLADLLQDARYAVRMLRRNPGFATLAILTLAIGVGATTSVYAIVDNILFRPVPYQHIERLVRVFETQPDRPDRWVAASYPNLLDWRARSRSFDAMGVYRTRELTLIDGDPERVLAGVATADFFTAAGAHPVLGRSFTEADSLPGAPRVVMLAHGAWQRRFGGDPSIIGRSLRTVDGPYEIVGVLAPARMFGASRELWIPYEVTAATKRRDARGTTVIARLRTGVTLEQARTEMNTIAAALANEHPENRGWGATVVPMQEWTVRGMRQPLYTFFGAVGCILLIACANVAGLLVARGAARSSEIAIRSSLGARHWRIVRQLVTESVVLAVVGGGLGALIAWLTIGALVPLFPLALPAEWIAVDFRVLAIAVAASGCTGAIFGLAPALALARSGASTALKDHGRSTPRWSRRLGSGLIVVEVALALILLAGAGLMVRTMMLLYAVDPGIDADRLIELRVTPLLPRDAPPHRSQEFYRQFIERIAAMPGVSAAAAIDTPPFGGSTWITSATSDVQVTPVAVSPRTVTPGYFDTMGMPLSGGRDFSNADAATTARVVVVNATAAAKLWPGASPLGRQLRFISRGEAGEPYEVVGVVTDVSHDGLGEEALAEVYQPATQRPSPDMAVVARAADPEAVGRSFRGLLAGLPERALAQPPQTFAALVDGTVEQRRNRTILLGVIATLGLALAAIGVFGLTAWSVTQRTKEIGVRIALGADEVGVLSTVIGSLVSPLVVGVLLGITGAWWASRILESFLWGVRPNDPTTLAGAVLIIVAVVLFACYLPARRALRVDPVIALRAE